MKKGFLILIGVVIAILILCAVFFSSKEGYTGTKDFGDNSMQMEFTKMTGTDSHTMLLESGDALQVSFAVTKGRFDVTIGMEGSDPIYRGDDLREGGFSVGVEQDGEYVITVTAKNAKGYFHVEREEE